MSSFSVTPLVAPMINWRQFLKDIKEATGTTPTRSVDSSGLKLGDYSKFIFALAELDTGQQVNTTNMQDLPRRVFAHLHFSFLIVASIRDIYDLALNSKLDLVSARTQIKGTRAVIASGTLENWLNFIEANEKPDMCEVLKNMFTRIGL